jgi:hypothetical protein
LSLVKMGASGSDVLSLYVERHPCSRIAANGRPDAVLPGSMCSQMRDPYTLSGMFQHLLPYRVG